MGSSMDQMQSIAIIGMSGRFPGEATNPSKLWELCAAGNDAWSPIPQDRISSKAFYHPEGGRNGTVSYALLRDGSETC